jgi:hypothetical protein
MAQLDMYRSDPYIFVYLRNLRWGSTRKKIGISSFVPWFTERREKTLQSAQMAASACPWTIDLSQHVETLPANQCPIIPRWHASNRKRCRLTGSSSARSNLLPFFVEYLIYSTHIEFTFLRGTMEIYSIFILENLAADVVSRSPENRVQPPPPDWRRTPRKWICWSVRPMLDVHGGANQIR